MTPREAIAVFLLDHPELRDKYLDLDDPLQHVLDSVTNALDWKVRNLHDEIRQYGHVDTAWKALKDAACTVEAYEKETP